MDRVVIKPYSKDKFELAHSYNYEDITIPAGFCTNGADVPRIFWSLFPPNSPEYLSAVVVHDYACELAGQGLISYKLADGLFYKAMREIGVSAPKAWLFFISCRAYHIIRLKG